MRFLSILLVLSSMAAQAQFKNIRLDASVEKIGKNGPAVAISRKNPDQMVVATQQQMHYTADNGATWQKVEVAWRAGKDWPRVVSDRKGNFYTFFLTTPRQDGYARVICETSEDGGAHWEARGEILAPEQETMLAPAVFIHPKTSEILLSWTQCNKAQQVSRIMMASSSNGKRWSDPLHINQKNGSTTYGDKLMMGASPASTMDGMLFVTWAADEQIYLDRSFNRGKMWLTHDIEIQAQPGGWNCDVSAFPQGHGMPTLCIDNSPSRYNGSLHLVWADQRKGENDTHAWYTRSVNYGDNWTSPIQLEMDGLTQQFMPAFVIDQTSGYIYILYYNLQTDEQQINIHLAYSVDNGNSFKSVRVNETTFTLSEGGRVGAYLAIDAYRGKIVPVWTQADGSQTTTCMAVIAHEDLEKAAIVNK